MNTFWARRPRARATRGERARGSPRRRQSSLATQLRFTMAFAFILTFWCCTSLFL